MAEIGRSESFWEFPYPSRRVPVLASNCVATTQPLAAQAGLTMLQKGGNAVDAALATAITLTVVEPASNGLGSDVFAMVWDGQTLHGLNGSGRAPAGCRPEQFDGPAMPHEGWLSATVPGAVASWMALSRRFGKLPFATLFEPAIRLAADGFLLTPVIAEIWGRQVERLRDQPGFAAQFLPHGRAPRAGEHFRPPHLAETLTRIAETEGEDFYRGAIAATIARTSQEGGGLFTEADLAVHVVDFVEPLDVGFRGHRIHELPPNGQGIGALIAIGILERCPIDGLAPDSPEMLHFGIEALKLGAADVREHVADPSAMRKTAAELLDPARLDAMARTISRDRVNVPAPPSMHRGATVYLTAADASGMMVSFIQSNYHGFGSGVVVPGTGIALNNRGSCFVTDPKHPNCIAPSKRPLNTIIPGFISRDGVPVASFGVMGGTMQPQGHTQMALRMLASGQNPQAAIDAPRWRVEGNDVWLEAAMAPAAIAGLAARGHHLIEDSSSLDFGAAQIIVKMQGGYLAASETRRDGCAVGF
jgi:gamma-glutamyltranspeptidase/glutathione hydrolase